MLVSFCLLGFAWDFACQVLLGILLVRFRLLGFAWYFACQVLLGILLVIFCLLGFAWNFHIRRWNDYQSVQFNLQTSELMRNLSSTEEHWDNYHR